MRRASRLEGLAVEALREFSSSTLRMIGLFAWSEHAGPFIRGAEQSRNHWIAAGDNLDLTRHPSPFPDSLRPAVMAKPRQLALGQGTRVNGIVVALVEQI